MLSMAAMPDSEASAALARIETALQRVEAVAYRLSASSAEPAHDDTLRVRTRAALAGLETVIAQLEATRGSR